jgi:hypothetical protein
MDAEENQSVTATIEPSESNQSTDRQEETQQQRNDQAYNWGEARRKMQELERKAQEQDELIRRLQASTPKEKDDLENLTDDDIVTVSQAKKLAVKMAQQVAENVVKQKDLSTLEDRINSKYPDFQEIVSKDAIDKLKSEEPELALSLATMQDPYQQAVAAYKLLKKLGGKEVMTLEQKKALENRSKPQSSQTIVKNSAIGNAHLFENGLTPELKKQLYQEMQQAMKGF